MNHGGSDGSGPAGGRPDLKSAHANSVRIVGYSTTAQTVITVAALRDRAGVLHGASAWKTTGAPLRQYLEDRPDD